MDSSISFQDASFDKARSCSDRFIYSLTKTVASEWIEDELVSYLILIYLGYRYGSLKTWNDHSRLYSKSISCSEQR